ncbi:hypothetical protein [Streptomyces griseoaurantiacus]|uniref:hypothetical protein n=1 Tax=Streptomyces griseoaurantiacus TaxID=68213 RepID=UPI0036B7703C
MRAPRIRAYDEDSVTVAIIPQNCGACGQRTDEVRMSLEAVVSMTAPFVGIRTLAVTPCCGGRREGHYPADMLARLLEHLQNCPNH